VAGADGHFTTSLLREGVHAAISIDGRHSLCNAGIIDLGGTTVVFDAMLSPAAGADLARAAERLTGRRPDFLVESHYHGDHIRGAASLGPVRAISTRRTRELIRERGRDHLQSDRGAAPKDLAELRAGRFDATERDRAFFEGWMEGILATPADLAFVLPEVLVEEVVVLQGTRRELRVATLGGGHSPSDTIAYLPDERVGFLGDLLTVGLHPSIADGNHRELSRILSAIAQLPIDTFVPGHGSVGTTEDLEAMIRYVEDLRELAREHRERGTPRAQVIASDPPAPYDAWRIRLFFRENLGFVFDTLDGPREPPGAA
jgi:cyclase